MSQTSRFKRHFAMLSEQKPDTRPLSYSEINQNKKPPFTSQEQYLDPPGRTPRPAQASSRFQKKFNHHCAHKITTLLAVVLAIVSLVLASIIAITLPSQNARIAAQNKIIKNFEYERNKLIEQAEQSKQTLALANLFNSALQIDSAPSGARVILSGNDLGATPLRMEGLAPGWHRLRLELEGYEPLEFETSLPEKDITNFGVLPLQRSVADLSLSAHNPDTHYTLQAPNGEKISEGNLPTYLENLPTGRYKLALRWGIHQREQFIDIKSGAANNHTVGFQTAYITLLTTPSGASVELNGSPLGETPITSAQVPAGTMRLALRAKGYQQETLDITLEPDELRTITITLKHHPGPPPGENFTNAAGIEMVWHPFGFWVARHEITQQVFQQITGTNPSTFRGSNMPVETLSWSAAADFARKLNTFEKENDMLPSGYRYTLPTERHWNAYAVGLPRSIADGDATASPRPVGGEPNAYGIHNVHDNVWEWSADSPPAQPLMRIALGGGWSAFYSGLEAQRRRTAQPRDMESPAIGFRVVLVRD